MASSLTGGCMCGKIRYECAAEPMFVVNCYCRDCQRASGTAMGTVVFVPKAALKQNGEAKYYEVTAESGKKIRRGFCSTCGSPLFSDADALPDGIGVKIASLDDPNRFKPGMNIYTVSAPAWASVEPTLTRFDKMPG